jgi:hypothetical protein
MITFDDAIRVNGSIIARGVIDRVNALLDGKTLVCRHELYGEFRFWLNPQQNVICCEAVDHNAKSHEMRCKHTTKVGIVVCDHDSVEFCPERFIFHGYGKWFIEEEPASTKTVVVEIPGKYTKLGD